MVWIASSPPYPLHVPLIRPRTINEQSLPPSDVFVATDSATAYYAHQLEQFSARVVHGIQGYESHEFIEKFVHETWAYPFPKIVVSTWLERAVRRKVRKQPIYTILNGVDIDFFTPPQDTKTRSKAMTIACPYSSLPSKGGADACKVLRHVHELHPHVSSIMFGSDHPKHTPPIRGSRYIRNPSDKRIRDIYRQADL